MYIDIGMILFLVNDFFYFIYLVNKFIDIFIVGFWDLLVNKKIFIFIEFIF